MLILVWNASLALSVAVALLRGGRDERLTALVLVLAYLAALLHQQPHWRHDGYSLMLDGMLLFFLAYRTFATNRWWPLYACAAQLGVLIASLGEIVAVAPSALGYRTSEAVWSYVIVAALLLETLLEHGRVIEERRSLAVASPP